MYAIWTSHYFSLYLISIWSICHTHEIFSTSKKKKKKKKIKCGVSLNSLATLHLVNKSYMFTMNASNSFFSVAICLVPLLLIVLIQLFISVFDSWNGKVKGKFAHACEDCSIGWNFYIRCGLSIRPNNRGSFYARYGLLISNSWSLNTLTIK